ncbi:hypothetical protein ZWY2020_055774 [Hordeum vulgare]|nr:hypothetical protein ZWY2020_055774 [Hordeum vulgare]
MFGTLLLAAGLAALCASEGGVGPRDAGLAALCASEGGVGPRDAGLAVAGVALAVVAAVNAHDLGAHLAGVDSRVGLARFDPQLGLVELLAPALHAAGCVLAIVGLALQLFSKVRRQVREARDAFATARCSIWLGARLMPNVWRASAVLHSASGPGPPRRCSSSSAVLHRRGEPTLPGESERWISLCGSVLWVAGALFNVLKVFVMHQSDACGGDGRRAGSRPPPDAPPALRIWAELQRRQGRGRRL